jgi:hypothetical protein
MGKWFAGKRFLKKGIFEQPYDNTILIFFGSEFQNN